ncbi:MAG: type II toxin-antitoxin system RatA family toxin [Proteobacteria bacterium]|nr:type II toxin-antitoxin system RatA family toxin [Pseudomonadota bacterium]
MPHIKRHAIVIYTPSEMYDLVNHIEDYPNFLPWCSGSEVLSRKEDEIQASITVEGMGIQKKFTTRNLLQKDKMIEVRLLDGPFQHLQGFWQFDLLEQNHCKVSLNLEYEFAGKALSFLFGPFFQQAANTFVDAFVHRAKEIYGNKSA